jgi:hypothetical protein
MLPIVCALWKTEFSASAKYIHTKKAFRSHFLLMKRAFRDQLAPFSTVSLRNFTIFFSSENILVAYHSKKGLGSKG